MADEVLAERLRDLGTRLDVPDAARLPDLVAARLRRDAAVVPLRRRRAPRGRTLLVAAALVLGGTAAVATYLELRGVEVRRMPTRPSAPPATSLGGLELGEPVSLEDAAGRVGVAPPVPSVLGSPDAVHVGDVPAGGRVTLLYRAREGLPRDERTGVGALITAFRAEASRDIILKQVGPGSETRQATVGGAPGLWITGAPHTLTYLDENGQPFTDATRLAGNVLLWQVGDVTYRLEADVALSEALRIAGSIPT